MPVSVRRHGGFMLASLGVAVFVVLALVVGFLLLPACGLRPLAGWLETCPPAPVAVLVALEEEAGRTAVLRDRIAQREREIAGLPACPPQPPRPLARPPEMQTQLEPPPEPEPSEFDERLEATGGEVSEELTVTLVWDDESDLDLEMHCPGGGTAGIGGTGCGGGVLDIDANGYATGGLRMMEKPVENIRFGANAPEGEHWIRIYIAESYESSSGYDRRRNLGRHPFRVRVISRGNEQVFEDVHPGLGQGDVWLNFTHR